jgi:putative transposase
MSRWNLSEQEWEALGRMQFATTESQVFRNVTIILMTAVGRTKESIASDLGCSPATVDNVRQRYRQRGREGLRRGQPPGRPSRATTEYRAALRQAVQTPPQQLGYGFSVWSVARLGQHLKEQTGISFSEDQLGRLLHQEGFSCQRPKHTLKEKRDEIAYAKAHQELHTMKKKPWPRRLTTC